MSLWCRATEHIFINHQPKAPGLHKEIDKIGQIDGLGTWGALPFLIYSLNQARDPMKTIVGILNYYLNPIFNNALDICGQLTRVSWWVFGNFITIWIETKCWAEGQDVTTITSRCHHLSDFFHLKLKFKASSGTIGNPFQCVSCLTRDPFSFLPHPIRRGDSKQLSPFPPRNPIIVTAPCRALRTSEGPSVDGPGVYAGGVRET